MWWGFLWPDGCDFSAEGDEGQVIHVSPLKRLVMVRSGTDFGLPASDWEDLFCRFASDL